VRSIFGAIAHEEMEASLTPGHGDNPRRHRRWTILTGAAAENSSRCRSRMALVLKVRSYNPKHSRFRDQGRVICSRLEVVDFDQSLRRDRTPDIASTNDCYLTHFASHPSCTVQRRSSAAKNLDQYNLCPHLDQTASVECPTSAVHLKRQVAACCRVQLPLAGHVCSQRQSSSTANKHPLRRGCTSSNPYHQPQRKKKLLTFSTTMDSGRSLKTGVNTDVGRHPSLKHKQCYLNAMTSAREIDACLLRGFEQQMCDWRVEA
jgi:hypothetical protein